MRHAEDHNHLVAILVDEHTGKRVHPYRDYPKLRAACQQLERELGLVRMAGADRTAAPAPTRAEQAKAARLGRVTQPQRRAVLAHTAQLIDHATAVVRDPGEQVDGIVHAAGELLAALSRGREGHTPGPLTELAQRYDRAARTSHHVIPPNLGSIARDPRHAARQLGAIGVVSGRGQEKLATITLLLALASLVTEIAAWQQLHGRPHQADAAHRRREP